MCLAEDYNDVEKNTALKPLKLAMPIDSNKFWESDFFLHASDTSGNSVNKNYFVDEL